MGDAAPNEPGRCRDHGAIAVAACARCGDFVCPDCRVWSFDQAHCVRCHNHLVTEGGTRKPNSGVRRGLAIGCVGLLGLGLLVLAGAGLYLWRLSSEMERYKAPAHAAIDRFAACLYAGDEPCVREATDWNDEVHAGAARLAVTLHDKLGERGRASAIPESWRINSAKETTLSVTFRTPYELDPNAIEKAVFVVRPDGTLRVRGFHVDSQRLIE
jgi:hypothetical protein